jgi:LuxR family transcriptional regulator, maltose regulon positive regulatory protein
MRRVLAVGTKCSIPRLPETLVRRPRLEGLLANEQRSQVTLVCGAPGAGKTTLLASWLATAPVGKVAWLTLDRRDNEPRRFATLVTAALERAGALAGLGASPHDGEDLLDAVFEHLVRRGQHVVLVLDDLQELASRPALRTLGHLVEQAPPALDLVLSSRADPPVPWGRLALEGRLRQVRNADLRFSPDEAGELFSRHGVRLGRDDTNALCERTEGWAAGLRLAACALSTDADPRGFVLSASATQVAVSDYLLTEVLDRQDEAAQQFLLRTSVVDRVTPDLAVTLTGDSRAGERLEALERRGIFLVELDQDGSYRYHALFGALLRARLRLRDRALFSALHRKAALWHLENEMPREAEEHARAAGEWSLVGRLVLGRWLDRALDGRRPAGDPTSGLSAGVVAATPELSLVAAAQASWRGERAEAGLHREVVSQVTLPGGTPTGLWSIAKRVVDVEFARAFGDEPQSRRAIRALADDQGGPAAWSARARRLAAMRRAELDVATGHSAFARKSLEQLVTRPADGPAADGHEGLPADPVVARAQAGDADGPGDAGEPWSASATGLLALEDALDGRLPAADERVAAALAGAARGLARDGLPQVTHLARALCCAQRGEARGLSDAVAAMDEEQVPNRTWATMRDLVRWADRHQVRRPVALAAEFAEQPLVGRTLVALGLLETIDRHGRVHFHGAPGELAVAGVRRLLASGPSGGPAGPEADALDAWLARVEAGELDDEPTPHPRTLVEAFTMSAVLAERRGECDLAGERLDRALALLEATSIRAPFDQHAERLGPALRRHAAQPGPHQALAVDLADRLVTGETTFVEALTDRELEVLNHLPTLMSNVEIAAGLHLSVNTVKSHLKAVYRKLGVDGRRHAVLRARELELI